MKDYLVGQIAMTETVYVVKLPLTVAFSGTSKKTFSLNLNVYRNAHHMTLAKAKVAFRKQVTPLLEGIPLMPRVHLVYTLFPRTKVRTDVGNVCSIVDKFFSDTIVHAGILADDDYISLPKVTYCFGAVDKLNPRVEVHIIPIP